MLLEERSHPVYRVVPLYFCRVDEEQPFPLLQLPDPCLLAVMQCLSHNSRSLFSAARAHSRLHQAAVMALSSIIVTVDDELQLDSVLLYLANHGQHVSNLTLHNFADNRPRADGGGAPLNLFLLLQSNLHSLELHEFALQLQPNSGYQGAAKDGSALEDLIISECQLLDGEEELAAALSALPSLQHLSIVECDTAEGDTCMFPFPTSALQRVQQLTYLELSLCEEQHLDSLQHWQALTGLQDLSLSFAIPVADTLQVVHAGMLSGIHHLTRLNVYGWGVLTR